jgi:hypothetical protein
MRVTLIGDGVGGMRQEIKTICCASESNSGTAARGWREPWKPWALRISKERNAWA